MDLVADGRRNAQIAEELVVSEATVKSHLTAIMRKLHVGNRAEAVARYMSLTAEPTG
jgi:DNA-binding NarL/FixJ family response regulator